MRLIDRVAGRRAATFALSEAFEGGNRKDWHHLTAADGSESYLFYSFQTALTWRWRILEIPKDNDWPQVARRAAASACLLAHGEAHSKAAAERQAIEQANAGIPRVALAEIRRKRLAKTNWG